MKTHELEPEIGKLIRAILNLTIWNSVCNIWNQPHLLFVSKSTDRYPLKANRLSGQNLAGRDDKTRDRSIEISNGSSDSPGNKFSERKRTPNAAAPMVVESDCLELMTDGRGLDRIALEEQRGDLELMLQKTRANIIQDILAHPHMMPSHKELSYYNPKSASTISGHIQALVEGEIVFQPAIPQGNQTKGNPNTFVTLTDKGYELLEKHRLFVPDQDVLQDEFESVEKTEDMISARDAPRPTVNVNYDHPLRGDGLSVVEPTEYDPDDTDDKRRFELKL